MSTKEESKPEVSTGERKRQTFMEKLTNEPLVPLGTPFAHQAQGLREGKGQRTNRSCAGRPPAIHNSFAACRRPRNATPRDEAKPTSRRRAAARGDGLRRCPDVLPDPSFASSPAAGSLVTVACLVGAMSAFRAKNPYRMNRMMQGRVLAQFFTVGAIVVGTFPRAASFVLPNRALSCSSFVTPQAPAWGFGRRSRIAATRGFAAQRRRKK
eukprot:scaffold1044_cov266-Pinguiococcus_pyrenoidosus.AAC.11